MNSKKIDLSEAGGGSRPTPLTCYAIIGHYAEHGCDPQLEFNGVFGTREEAIKQAEEMRQMCYVTIEIIETEIGKLRL